MASTKTTETAAVAARSAGPAAASGLMAGEGLVLWVIWLTYGSFYFCRQNIAAAVAADPGLKGEGLSETQIGAILGALKIAYGVGQLVNGQLADCCSSGAVDEAVLRGLGVGSST